MRLIGEVLAAEITTNEKSGKSCHSLRILERGPKSQLHVVRDYDLGRKYVVGSQVELDVWFDLWVGRRGTAGISWFVSKEQAPGLQVVGKPAVGGGVKV